MNDTTRRFLDAVLERVPEARIVEVRLFPAIRQGGVESGIAVLAVDPDPPLPIPDAPELEAGLESMFEPFGEDSARDGETPVDLVAIDDDAANVDPDTVVPATRATTDAEAPLSVPPQRATTDAEAPHSVVPPQRVTTAADAPLSVVPAKRATASAEPEPSVVPPHALDDRTTAIEMRHEGITDAPTQELPVAPDQPTSEIAIDLARAGSDSAAEAAPDEDIALGDILALPSPDERAAPGHDRLAILCARYKLIVKGPDRGKWDVEIVHQADAPLGTLDHVIKGVVRRSGDDAVPERYTRQSLRDLLDAPAWATDV
jgi:hypothetical protein